MAVAAINWCPVSRSVGRLHYGYRIYGLSSQDDPEPRNPAWLNDEGIGVKTHHLIQVLNYLVLFSN